MPRIRAEKTGKYQMSKHEFYTAYHFALQYPYWKEKLQAMTDSVRSVRYDGMPHGNMTTNPTESLAIKRAAITEKMEKVDDSVNAAVEGCEWLHDFLFKAVTTEGVTYNNLKTMYDMPCEKDMYYDRRRKFYFILNQKIQ